MIKAFEEWFNKSVKHHRKEYINDNKRAEYIPVWDVSGEYHTKKAVKKCIEILEKNTRSLRYEAPKGYFYNSHCNFIDKIKKELLGEEE